MTLIVSGRQNRDRFSRARLPISVANSSVFTIGLATAVCLLNRSILLSIMVVIEPSRKSAPSVGLVVFICVISRTVVIFVSSLSSAQMVTPIWVACILIVWVSLIELFAVSMRSLNSSPNSVIRVRIVMIVVMTID